MATHSSTLAWKIPWTEEPGRLQSMGSLRVRHDWATSLSPFTFMRWRRKWQPTPVFLPGESQGCLEPGGLPSMGSHRVRHDWSDLAAALGKYDFFNLLWNKTILEFPSFMLKWKASVKQFGIYITDMFVTYLWIFLLQSRYVVSEKADKRIRMKKMMKFER